MSLTFRSSALTEAIKSPENFLHPTGATTTITNTGAFIPFSVIQELTAASSAQRAEFVETLFTKVAEPRQADDTHAKAMAALDSACVKFTDTLAKLATK
jgi:hypothetical protein